MVEYCDDVVLEVEEPPHLLESPLFLVGSDDLFVPVRLHARAVRCQQPLAPARFLHAETGGPVEEGVEIPLRHLLIRSVDRRMIRVGLVPREVQLRHIVLHVPERVSHHDHEEADADELLPGVDWLPPPSCLLTLNRRLTLLDKGDYTSRYRIQLTGVGQRVTLPVTVSPMVLSQRTSEPTPLLHGTAPESRESDKLHRKGIRRQPPGCGARTQLNES